MNRHDAARDYAQRGWHVIALHHVTPDGVCTCRKGAACGKRTAKHPVASSWQDADQLTDPDLATHFMDGEANIGIATGAVSGVWVLDVDGEAGETSLAALGPLPATYEVRTGSGGRHFYFALREGEIVPSTQGRLGRGLDTRGEGGQVVAPPSVSGVGPYTVERDVDLAYAPEWLVASLQPVEVPEHRNVAPPTNPAGYLAALLDGTAADLKALHDQDDGWDAGTFRVAVRLAEVAKSDWNELTREQAHAHLHAHAPLQPVPTADYPVPWTSEHVEAKWRSAWKRAQPVAPPADPYAASAFEDPFTAPDRGPGVRSRTMGGGSFFLDVPSVPPAVWGEGSRILWSEGEPAMLVAPPGVGKTTLAQQVLLHRIGIREGDLLGFPVKRSTGRTLYLAMDRPPQIARSMRRGISEQDREALDERVVVWRGPPPAAARPEAGPGAFATWVTSFGDIDTVIVDSLKDLCFTLGDGDSGAAVNSAFQELIVVGIEVLVLHHQRKAGADNSKPNKLDDVYGSTWLTAGMGNVVLLWGEAGALVVELTHLKQTAETIGPLTLIHDHNTLTTTLFEVGQGDPKATLAKFPEGVDKTKFAVALFGKTKPDRNEKARAYRSLENLVSQKRARKVDPPDPQQPATYFPRHEEVGA